MTEKDVLYRCEQNFLSPDEETGHAVTCECCGDGDTELFDFWGEKLCVECIKNRLCNELVDDGCIEGFLDAYSTEFRDFISGYYDPIS